MAIFSLNETQFTLEYIFSFFFLFFLQKNISNILFRENGDFFLAVQILILVFPNTFLKIKKIHNTISKNKSPF